MAEEAPPLPPDGPLPFGMLLSRHARSQTRFATRAPSSPLKCPVCNFGHREVSQQTGNFRPQTQHACSHGCRVVYMKTECPICIENVDPPVVAFPCGHGVCKPCFERLGGRTGDAANRARGRNLDRLMDARIGPFYEDDNGFLRRVRTARENSGSRAHRSTSFNSEAGIRGRAGDPDDRGRINQGVESYLASARNRVNRTVETADRILFDDPDHRRPLSRASGAAGIHPANLGEQAASRFLFGDLDDHERRRRHAEALLARIGNSASRATDNDSNSASAGNINRGSAERRYLIPPYPRRSRGVGAYRASRTLDALTASRATGDNANADSASSDPSNGNPDHQDSSSGNNPRRSERGFFSMNESLLSSTIEAHIREMRQGSSNGTSQASSSDDSDPFLEFSRRAQASRPDMSHRARSSGQASSVTAGQLPTNRNRRDQDGSQTSQTSNDDSSSNSQSLESVPEWELQERRLDALQQDNSSNRNMGGAQNPFGDSPQSDDVSNSDGDEDEDTEVNGEDERSGDEANAAVAFLRRQRQRRRALSMRILSRGADTDISPFFRRALSESATTARRRHTVRENSGYRNSRLSSLVRRRALLENARGNSNAGTVGASVRRDVHLSDGNRDNESGDDSDETGRRSANIDGTSRNRPLHINDSDEDSNDSSIGVPPLPSQHSDDQQTAQNNSSNHNDRDDDSDDSSIFPLPLPSQQSDDQQTSQNQSSNNNNRDEGIFNVARRAASFFGNFRNSIDGAEDV